MTNASGLTQARAATLAGALYVATNLTAVAGLAIQSMVAGAGDASATARGIMTSERLYRAGVALDLATVAGVVVLVWALYVLLRPVNRDLALLAVMFRLIENAVLAVMVVTLTLALRVLSRPDYLNTFDVGQLESLARLLRGSHGLGFTIGFMFLGLGSAVFAGLLLKSRYIPRWFAAFGVGASLLMALCSVLMIVFPGAARTLQVVSFAPIGLYEVGVGVWLMIRGVDLTLGVVGGAQP